MGPWAFTVASLALLLILKDAQSGVCYHFFDSDSITYDVTSMSEGSGRFVNRRMLIGGEVLVGDVIYNVCDPVEIDRGNSQKEWASVYMVTSDQPRRVIVLLDANPPKSSYEVVNGSSAARKFLGYKVFGLKHDFKVRFSCVPENTNVLLYSNELQFESPEACGYLPYWYTVTKTFKIPICIFLIIDGFLMWICGGVKQSTLQGATHVLVGFWTWLIVFSVFLQQSQRDEYVWGLAIVVTLLYIPTRLVFHKFRVFSWFLFGTLFGLTLSQMVFGLLVPLQSATTDSFTSLLISLCFGCIYVFYKESISIEVYATFGSILMTYSICSFLNIVNSFWYSAQDRLSGGPIVS